jgi:hypothetical protein
MIVFKSRRGQEGDTLMLNLTSPYEASPSEEDEENSCLIEKRHNK